MALLAEMDGLRIIPHDHHDRYAAAAVIRHQLLDALLIHRSDGAVITIEDNYQNLARRVVRETVRLPINTGQIEVRSMRTYFQNRRHITRGRRGVVLAR